MSKSDSFYYVVGSAQSRTNPPKDLQVYACLIDGVPVWHTSPDNLIKFQIKEEAIRIARALTKSGKDFENANSPFVIQRVVTGRKTTNVIQ